MTEMHASSSYPYTLVINKMWGKTSALVDMDTPFYNLKNAFTQSLFNDGLLKVDDLDRRNITSHIDLGANNPEETRRSLNHSVYHISLNHIIIGTNLVEFTIGIYHFSLVYKRGIGQHAAHIRYTLAKLLPQHCDRPKTQPKPTPEPENKKNDNDSDLCVICYDTKREMILTPCMHYCVCQKCSTKVTLCPVCRKVIDSAKRVFTA